jgi:myo-inositol-1(or 4)-monophosphatase
MNKKETYLFTKDIARQAGRLLLRRSGKIGKISFKGRMNLTTDVDKSSEKLILKAIRSRFPGHSILAEESGQAGSSRSRYCWFVDPLDGTTNYTHAFPFYAVSIALYESGSPVCAAVYDPVSSEMFSAQRGKGAYLNNKKIKISNIRSIERSLLATGFPYKFGRQMRRNLGNFKRAMLRSQAVRRAGSAALDLCYVACGRFDAFWEIDLHPWDSAAGIMILQEAGGRVTTFKGARYDPFENELCATNKYVHAQLLKVLK